MALSLKQLTNNAKGFVSRQNSLAMLEHIAKRQAHLLINQTATLEHAYVAAHYPHSVAKIEHICRLLWGTLWGGESIEANHVLREMILRGCDPSQPSYWGSAQNYDQRVVEMSAIATAMIDAQETFWTPLSTEQKQLVVNWLLTVRDLELPENNWRWFRILVLTALDLVGFETDHAVRQQDLAFIEQLHYADGWYQDGLQGAVDYYNPFAFQLYALMYVRWTKSTDALSKRLLARAVEFAERYQYWFADDGQPLCYGRSLNYRFAGAAFWVEFARCEHPQVDVSLARACWQQTMEWWAEQPIWDSNAQLLPGYAYPNLLTSEFYTSYASPMLALKAFNVLALSPQHPFWQAELATLSDRQTPIRIGDHHQIIRHGGSYLITNSRSANELRHSQDKYSKFSYSSDHGMCVESCRWIEQGWAGDNILAFCHPETQQWMSRKKNLTTKASGEKLISTWQPFSGCRITSTQYFSHGKEIRHHQIKTNQPLSYLMTGYAVDCWSAWYSHLHKRVAKVESARLFSQLTLTEGVGETAVYPCAPNTNLLFPHASVPAVRGEIPPGESVLLVEVYAGRQPDNHSN